MSEIHVTHPTTLIKATCIYSILDEYNCDEPDYSVAIQRINADDGISPIGYRLELHGVDEPLQIDMPAALNTLDIITLARTLDKAVPAHYPLLPADTTRRLAHKMLLWADDILSYEKGTCLSVLNYSGEHENTRCVRIRKEFDDSKPYILVTLIENKAEVKRLNSRDLKWLLKREPEILVFGTKDDKRCFEMTIDNPDSLPAYCSIDKIDTKGYHLMPFAQRIGYKLMQVKHDNLLFTKRGTKINFNLNKGFHKTLGL